MPKQILKIDQFHGGINTNADPRDLMPNELSSADDIMVDEFGIIRLMGGLVGHSTVDARANQISSGYGLFKFSHDRKGAHILSTDYVGSHTGSSGASSLTDSAATFPTDALIGATIWNVTDGSTATITDNAGTTVAGTLSGGTDDDWDTHDVYVIRDFPETGDDYLAFSEADTGGTVDIYSNASDQWGSPITGMTDNTSGIRKDNFYYADGGLRIADSDFGNANAPRWYGYVHRYFFGDGTSGYDGSAYNQGVLISKWFNTTAAPAALPIKSFFGYLAGGVPDISNPIAIDLDTNADSTQDVSSGSDTIQDDVTAISVRVIFSASSSNVTCHASGNTDPGFSRFCQIGDKILILSAVDANNNTIFTVADVPEYGTDPDPNVMDFEESVTAEADDTVFMYNLSRSAWFDPVNTGWQVAVSTLYDDNKQESALNISSTTLQPLDIITTNATNKTGSLTDARSGYDQFRIDAHIFAGNGTTTGLPVIYSRVSGFKIYMRRENTSTWYLQAEIDMTKGNKWYGRGDWEIWKDGAEMTDCAHADGEYLKAPRQIETYESETGYDSSINSIGFDGTDSGFKTAVVANRIAYAGNVRIKDSVGNIKTHGDAILKSVIGKFDSFTYERRLETATADGDEIVKLEEYADRLLEFKKNKMTLINISQDIEFLEDSFMHKGILHPTAVCKTDFGIAWVNSLGCYLYDGQKVDNLIEKDGRQIIKESDWDTFTTDNSTIGYIPKKRQLIVAKDCTATSVGDIFLYDMVTRSWVKGDSALTDSQIQTNFVIDWNNDLVWAHTTDTGTVVKWDDTSDTSTAMVISTKDIDFGQPGQKKNVYKVIITYQSGNSTTNVQVDYGVNGDTSFTYDFTVPELPAANGWQTAELVPDVPSEAKNIKSIRLRFATDDTVPAAFEINDISVIYRLKGKR